MCTRLTALGTIAVQRIPFAQLLVSQWLQADAELVAG